MNVWNKVLFVLLFLTSLTFFWLVSQRYMLGKTWEEKIASLDEKYTNLLSKRDKLQTEIYSDSAIASTPWESLGLKARLERVRALQRGSIWLECVPGMANQAENQFVTLSFELPVQYDASGVLPNEFVYLFDSGVALSQQEAEEDVPAESAPSAELARESKATYLGVFKVVNTGATPNQEDANQVQSAATPATIQLESVNALTQDEYQAISTSLNAQNSWMVSAERLPMDITAQANFLPQSAESASEISEDLFENLAENNFAFSTSALEQLSADSPLPVDLTYLLDQKIRNRDYLNVMIQRKAIAKADVNKVLISQVVDLVSADASQFTELTVPLTQSVLDFAQNVRLSDALNTTAALVDPEELKAAVTQNETPDSDAFVPESYLAQTNRLSEEMTKMENQRDLVKSKLDDTNATLAQMSDDIDELLQKNCELASKITQIQLRVAESIIQNNQTALSDSDNETIL